MFRRTSKAFTLIEIVIVVAIIALIASIIVSNVISAKKQAQDIKTADERDQVRTALQIYYQANGGYPKIATAGACVGSTCYVANNQISASLVSQLNNTSLKNVTTQNINGNQGFVYVGSTTCATSPCPSGTEYLAYPTYASGLVCQTVGIWETPFPCTCLSGSGSLANTCAPNASAGGGSGYTGNGGTGSPNQGNLICTGSPQSVNDDGSSHSVTWTATPPAGASGTLTYTWVNENDSSSIPGSTASVSATYTSTQIHNYSSAAYNYQIAVGVNLRSNGTVIGSASCSVGVIPSAPSVTCQGVSGGSSIEWIASTSGGSGNFTYAWTIYNSSDQKVASETGSAGELRGTYSPDTYTANVSVTDNLTGKTSSSPATCTATATQQEYAIPTTSSNNSSNNSSNSSNNGSSDSSNNSTNSSNSSSDTSSNSSNSDVSNSTSDNSGSDVSNNDNSDNSDNSGDNSGSWSGPGSGGGS